MHKRTTPKVFKHAKQLRRNQTEAEAKLWSRLRNHQLKDIGFRRQHAIGSYVVDFYAPRKKRIIELDGGQHLEQEVYDICSSRRLGGGDAALSRFYFQNISAQWTG